MFDMFSYSYSIYPYYLEKRTQILPYTKKNAIDMHKSIRYIYII